MSTTWPLLLDMTKEESIQYLRNLELEAYSHLVSALRAQGPLNSDKRRLLQDTSEALNITQERYKAEIRRAISDERLNTVAYHVSGQTGSVDDWAQEGRRIIPLLPRTMPHTCYSALADDIADVTSQSNKQLPSPSCTERKRLQNPPPTVAECNSKVQVPFRIPEAPIKAQEESKKRKLPVCTENSSLAQHLLGPAKMSRIQQLYRQRSKVRTKEQQNTVKYKQEEQYPKCIPTPPPVSTCTDNDVQNPPKLVKHNISLKPLTVDVTAKTIKMCTQTTPTPPLTTLSLQSCKKAPATTTATTQTITKTINSGQKLIVVSNAQTLQSNSILQRTLSIPFVKNISVKNIDKFKIVTTNSTSLNVTTITNTLNANNSVKHKVVTVRTNANKKVIPLSQIQMLNTKGSIKVLPLSGKIVGKTATSTSGTAPLYIVNPANSKPAISVTTVTKQMEMECKEEMSEMDESVTSVSPNKENSSKSSVLEDILKASGVINEDYDEKISEFHIVQKATEGVVNSTGNSEKIEENDATIIEVKPESGDEFLQETSAVHEMVRESENESILETNSNDINDFQ